MLITADLMERVFNDIIMSPDAQAKRRALFEIIERKNKQYGGSWEVDHMLTSLTDLRDKLYRTEVLRETIGDEHVVVGQTVQFSDKLRDVLVDIIIRAQMGLMKMDELEGRSDVSYVEES